MDTNGLNGMWGEEDALSLGHLVRGLKLGERDVGNAAFYKIMQREWRMPLQVNAEKRGILGRGDIGRLGCLKRGMLVKERGRY